MVGELSQAGYSSQSLRTLPNHNVHIPVSALGRDIQEAFNTHPNTPGILILSNDDDFLGMVSRRRFMELFSKPYRIEIFSNRSVDMLLHEINVRTLLLNANEAIDKVANMIVNRDQAEFSEPVVVQIAPREYRVVDCQVLLSALSQNYADQYLKLEAAKDILVQNEKLASLGSLVAGIAHEINTPVGVSITAISSLLDQVLALKVSIEAGTLKRSELFQTLADLRDLSETSLRTLRRAAELVQSFKQISADQVSEAKREFELGEELQHIVVSLRRMAADEGCTLSLAEGNQVSVNSFPGAVSQIVSNLIVNAIKHAFDGREGGEITIRYHTEGLQMALVEISDNGKGIPPENIERIFDPFFTTKRNAGGTGLGLSIVHNLAHKTLDGSISLKSTLGQGTCFSLKFPLHAPETSS